MLLKSKGLYNIVPLDRSSWFLLSRQIPENDGDESYWYNLFIPSSLSWRIMFAMTCNNRIRSKKEIQDLKFGTPVQNIKTKYFKLTLELCILFNPNAAGG